MSNTKTCHKCILTKPKILMSTCDQCSEIFCCSCIIGTRCNTCEKNNKVKIVKCQSCYQVLNARVCTLCKERFCNSCSYYTGVASYVICKTCIVSDDYIYKDDFCHDCKKFYKYTTKGKICRCINVFEYDH